MVNDLMLKCKNVSMFVQKISCLCVLSISVIKIEDNSFYFPNITLK